MKQITVVYYASIRYPITTCPMKSHRRTKGGEHPGQIAQSVKGLTCDNHSHSHSHVWAIKSHQLA